MSRDSWSRRSDLVFVSRFQCDDGAVTTTGVWTRVLLCARSSFARRHGGRRSLRRARDADARGALARRRVVELVVAPLDSHLRLGLLYGDNAVTGKAFGLVCCSVRAIRFCHVYAIYFHARILLRVVARQRGGRPCVR